jgi:hypothetical protein
MPWFIPVGLTAASAIGGALSNRSKLSSGQKQLAGATETRLTDILKDPSAGTDVLRTTGRTNINTLYKGAGDTIARQMAARGFGQSGVQGKAQVNSELARRAQMAGLEGDIARYILEREQEALRTSTNYLSNPLGSNKLGGALGSGGETAAYLYANR